MANLNLTNEERAQRAEAVLAAYQGRDAGDTLADNIVDLVVDLLHLARQNDTSSRIGWPICRRTTTSPKLRKRRGQNLFQSAFNHGAGQPALLFGRKLRNGRKPRPIPEVLTPDEQARLLAQVDLEAPSGTRNHAIIRLMLNTGLRAAEVRELRHRNIDWKSGRMKIRGKGGRDRVLWLAEGDLAMLKEWLDQKPSGNSSGTLFTSLDGQKPLCGRWLRKLIPRLAAQAGIDKRIHPHTLRHTFATNLLRQEKNLFLVSKALGHANLSTTQIYLHLEDSELETAMKRLGSKR